jgi:tRNA pseudouridine38/39 synthase
MRDAAARLVGEHDFRNLCKVDASKQLTVFTRRVLRAEINAVDGGLVVLDLAGTAFLYNQVRHIAAILLLVGTGLEPPSIVDTLLDVRTLDRKPVYEIADALPLVLWDCGYASDAVHWQTDADAGPAGGPAVYTLLDHARERSAVVNALDAHFLSAASVFHRPPPAVFPLVPGAVPPNTRGETILIPLGGGRYRQTGKYVPLMQRKRLDPVEVVNERWRRGKGSRRSDVGGSAAGAGVEDDQNE